MSRKTQMYFTILCITETYSVHDCQLDMEPLYYIICTSKLTVATLLYLPSVFPSLALSIPLGFPLIPSPCHPSMLFDTSSCLNGIVSRKCVTPRCVKSLSLRQRAARAHWIDLNLGQRWCMVTAAHTHIKQSVLCKRRLRRWRWQWRWPRPHTQRRRSRALTLGCARESVLFDTKTGGGGGVGVAIGVK